MKIRDLCEERWLTGKLKKAGAKFAKIISNKADSAFKARQRSEELMKSFKKAVGAGLNMQGKDIFQWLLSGGIRVDENTLRKIFKNAGINLNRPVTYNQMRDVFVDIGKKELLASMTYHKNLGRSDVIGPFPSPNNERSRRLGVNRNKNKSFSQNDVIEQLNKRLDRIERALKISESAASGSTSSANISTVAKPLNFLSRRNQIKYINDGKLKKIRKTKRYT